MNQQIGRQDDIRDTNRNSMASSNQGPQAGMHAADEAEMQPPPSRGTDFTEQEAFDRRTANTSPTHGYNPASSQADSVRPLYRKPEAARNLTLDINKTYKAGPNTPTPTRTPHSLRSSFLMPRMDSSHSNREMEGGEKLESLASSPQLPPSTRDGKAPSKEKDQPKLGRNYQYFLGNTVFFFGGRLQNTRHRPVNIATGSFVAIPAILFFVFSAPWLWDNLSPAIPIIFAYVFFLCMSSFIHASVSDPGVRPTLALCSRSED
jgi:palmitoyltransferase ZDHHC9/14/18